MFAHLLSNVLLAQAAQSNPLGQLSSIGMIVMMFGVVYFLLIRPANKQRREHQELLTALKKDDEIVTSGGMWGKIIALEDKFATIEIADKVKVKLLRDRIQGRWPTAKADAKDSKDAKVDESTKKTVEATR